ncbi:MAG: hypothetical protein AAGF11_16985 [Myxococcota bacterium]
MAMTLGACVSNYADELDRDLVGGPDPDTGGGKVDDVEDEEDEALDDSDGGSADEGGSNSGSSGDDGTTGDDSDGGQAGVFQREIVPILLTYCGCHLGVAPSGDLDLSPSVAYDVMVGAPSTSALLMVAPGSADDSYFIHKMEGTQGSVPGGWGTPMPPSGSSLPADDLQVIIDWVNDGAPR